MEANTVSIIVPLFNQQRYIGKCLRSICRQSYRKLEIIVVNDGSTDHSPAIVEKMSRKDNRIRIIHQANAGTSMARKNGLDQAIGAYIMFVDADDYLPPHSIQRLHNAMTAHAASMVIGQMARRYTWFYTKKGRRRNEKEAGTYIPREQLMEDYYLSFFGYNILSVSMCGRLYRKDTIDRARQEGELFHPTVTHMGEDELFNLMLHPYLDSLYITNDVVYTYRYGGITCTYNRYLTELFDFADLRIRQLDHYHYTKGYHYLFIEYKNVLLSELTQQLLYHHTPREQLLAFLRREISNRYLVKRMKDYYSTHAPHPSLLPILQDNPQALYQQAQALCHQQRKRHLLKKVLKHII